MALTNGSGWRAPRLLDLDKSYNTHHSRAKGSNSQGPDTLWISRMPSAAQTVTKTCWHQKLRVKSCQGSSTGSFSSLPLWFLAKQSQWTQPSGKWEPIESPLSSHGGIDKVCKLHPHSSQGMLKECWLCALGGLPSKAILQVPLGK